MRSPLLAGVFAIGVTHAQDVYDAVIVGGGLSGLGAAKALSEAGKSFVVLEARDRTGGRVHTVQLENGGYVEVGAQFIGPTQDEVIALALELDLALYETYDTGNNVLYHQGEAKPYESDSVLGAIPPVDIISLTQLLTIQGTLDAMATEIDIENPWNSTKAAEWDSITLEAWLDDQLLTETARFLLDATIHSVFSVEADELSLLYSIAYIAAAGNATTPGTFERLTSTGDGAQMWRVDGGTELLASRLAERVGNVRLSSPVQSIAAPSEAGSPYVVTVADGTEVLGEHVIVAMSPPMADLITYDPPLPAARKALSEQVKMGILGKAIGIYETPFWREDGLTGQAVSDAGLGRVTYDSSPRDPTHGAVMAFLEADNLREYLDATDEEISAQVQSDFVNYFGEQAANATEWVVFVWNREEYSRGGPTAVAGPGIYTQYGPALKQQVGNLHFAGTESSDYWVGYMDGALRSGYRVAAEVIV
jgi:monoamine oxidase